MGIKYAVEDNRKITAATLPVAVEAEALYILEETGDRNNEFKVIKAPDAIVQVLGSVTVKFTTALGAGDEIIIGGHKITAYAGSPGTDTYGVNVSTANTITLQVTAIKAMAFTEFTVSGAADTVTLTQKIVNVGSVEVPSVDAMEIGRATVSGVTAVEAVPSLLNSYTLDPYRFLQTYPKSVCVWFDGAHERAQR